MEGGGRRGGETNGPQNQDKVVSLPNRTEDDSLTPHSADVTDVLCSPVQDNQGLCSLESLLLQCCTAKGILSI